MKPLRYALFVLLALLVISEPVIPPRATAETTGASGWFHVIWSDSPAGSSVRYVLIDEHGKWTDLILDEALLRGQGGGRRLKGQPVRIIGTARSGLSARPVMDVLSIEPGPGSGLRFDTTPLAASGARPWVTILCRFGDLTAVTPHDLPWFEAFMGSVYPGLDHYWQEVSYGNINLGGSQVVGWYNLPHPRSYYVHDTNGNGIGESDAQRLMDDCTAQADADVFFPSFTGISLMFNGDLLCGGELCAFGGSTTLTRDAQSKQYAVAWMPSRYFQQGIQAHEMGHGFGLPHSSGPYTQIYDSLWDVMSAPTQQGQCLPDPRYGCAGVHTISHHKDLLGWIPPSRKFVPSPGTSQTIILDRLAQPTGGNYLMAQIPIAKLAGQFYTIEARRSVGYDVEIPGDAIVIHRVNPTIFNLNTPHARVVDPDGNGNPNDEGAMWTPGEIWEDAENGVAVSVDAATETGFLVTITYAPLSALLVNGNMETDGNADGVPDGWTLTTNGKDRRICNPLQAHGGMCSFRFKGDGSPQKNILKQVIAHGGMAGDTLDVALFARAKNLPAGAAKLVLKIKNVATGQTEKVAVKLPPGTYGYQRISLEHLAGSVNALLTSYSHIVLTAKVGGPAVSKLFLDDVGLVVTPR